MEQKELKITANLAMLDLNDQELEKLDKAISEILEYFARMNQADCSALEPTTHAFHKSAQLRPDTVRVFEEQELLHQNMPEKEDAFAVIPNVL